MKNKLIISLFIMFSICFVNVNKAYANSMEIVCDKDNIDVGETVSCKVVGHVEEVVAGISARIGSDSHLEVSNIANISPLPGDLHIYYMDGFTTIQPGTFNIASFNVKGLSSGTGGLTLREYKNSPDGEYSPLGYINSNGTRYIEIEPVNKYITVGGSTPTPPSSDSSLTSLVPNVGELDPSFTSNIFLYNMSVDFTTVGRVSFTATASDPLADVGNTNCDIPTSTSLQSITCNIDVTAPDRSKSTYSVTINNSAYIPPLPPTGDIFINRLTYDVDAVLTPKFKKDVYNYEMSVNFYNINEINFNAEVDDGVTVTGTKCSIPSSPNIESTICELRITKGSSSNTYTIKVNNTNSPDVKCELIVKSNVYLIDQDKKVIKVNKEHTKETIKANLYSTCGEINVFDDKVVISYGANSSTYTLERVINPQTGNNKILYSIAIVSVLAIIGIGIFAKKKLFSKED